MDNRIIEFVRGLRAAGVRVSLAESMDAMRAVGVIGVAQKEMFRQSLRTTLVKESTDFPVFDELFSLFFSGGGPPLQNALEDLTPDEKTMLKAALAAMSGRLQKLLDWLTSGQGPGKGELEELARRAGADPWLLRVRCQDRSRARSLRVAGGGAIARRRSREAEVRNDDPLRLR